MNNHSNQPEENLDENEVLDEQDDELMDWVPPELVERARLTAEREEKAAQMPSGPPKAKSFARAPKGKNKTLALAMLAGAILFLLVGTILAGTGNNAQISVANKGRVWLVLWLTSQALVLCMYLLFLLPLKRDMRRPSLITIMGAYLVFTAVSGGITLMKQDDGGSTLGVRIAAMVVATLIVLLLTPAFWLFRGALRRRSAEKAAALMCFINVFVTFFSLISTLTKGAAATAATPVYVSALEVAQGICFFILLTQWPVLDRPVLGPDEQIGAEENESTEN